MFTMESSSMLEFLKEFEKQLVANEFISFCTDNFKQVSENDKINRQLSVILSHVIQNIVISDYSSVLQYNRFDIIYKDVGNEENFNALDCQIKEFIFFFIGVSSLQEFIRHNFCGPHDSESKDYNVIDQIVKEIDSSDLSIDGESIYSQALYPKLLLASRYLLYRANISSSLTLKWWLLRCKFVYQTLLSERNESLHKDLVFLMNEIQNMNWISEDKNITQKLLFSVECCHIFLYYGEVVQARRCIKDAQRITGLHIELSGAMGKRTQYQQKPVAQLLVKLERKHNDFISCRSLKQREEQKNDIFPSDRPLQDDIVLNYIEFVDENKHKIENLCAEEQLVLLAFCCLAKRSGSFEELLQEELISYINCLLCQPQIWSIYLKALVMRCKIEKNNSRKMERAVMQMEAIVKAVHESSLPLKERIKYFYCCSFPTHWMLEKDLADLLLSIGCTKSALEVYERLQLWEEIVECYVRLGRTSSAEKIIQDQLEKGDSILLLCLLGDVTENTEHYHKAWELSQHRSARAQRSLGYYYYKRKEYEKSIPHFVSSLEINHLQPQVWFSTGHAATQVENFELAARAYRQVVMFDEDSFEAWNNLANAYIKTKQKERAWRSLQEALKCNYEEWRVWENFLLVCTDIGAFEDALRAWHRLLDIKGKHCDTLLLEILVNAVINNRLDINGQPSSRLKKRTLELLGRITAITINEPKVWALYASLTSSKSEEECVEKEALEKATLYQQKALRYYNQKGSWERDFALSKEVLMSAVNLAELSLTYIKLLDESVRNQHKATARLNLQTIVARSRKFVDFSEDEKNELTNILDSLLELLNKILEL